MKPKVGLLTSKKFISALEEDRLLLEDLQAQNINAVQVVWDNGEIDFKTFDLIIVRAVWDYFKRFKEFSGWLDFAESEKANILNAPAIIRENINKLYLKKLSNDGVSIIPSLFYEKLSKPDVSSMFDELETDSIILKPVIGGGAYNLHKAERSESKDVNEIIDKINYEDFIVQKYMDEVRTDGEISLVFFNNEYSHSVRKMPGKGDFRVQGGEDEYYDPDNDLIEQARGVLLKTANNTLYARIDCFYFDKNFQLVEAELFEPQLFTEEKKFRNNFVNAILERIK